VVLVVLAAVFMGVTSSFLIKRDSCFKEFSHRFIITPVLYTRNHVFGSHHTLKPMEPTKHQYDFLRELETAASMGLFGSVDANRGDPRNGWDTDHFPNSFYETTLAMLTILRVGGGR
jgi:xylose isomerase